MTKRSPGSKKFSRSKGKALSKAFPRSKAKALSKKFPRRKGKALSKKFSRSKAKVLPKQQKRVQKFPAQVIRWLPEELRMEILLRMPLSDIVKCTLVCKEWKASVESEYLARLSTKVQREACLLFYIKHKLMMKCPELPKLAVLAKPIGADLNRCLSSSSKGLLCYPGDTGFVVCNPVVGDYRLLEPVEHSKMTLKTVKLVVEGEMKCSFRVGVSYYAYDERRRNLRLFRNRLKSRIYDSESNKWNEMVIPPEPDFAQQGLTLTEEVLQGSSPLVLFAASGCCDHNLHDCWLPLAKVPCKCPSRWELDMRLVVYEEQKSWSTYNLPRLHSEGLLFVKGFVDKGRCILATVSMTGVAGKSRMFSVLLLDHAGKEWKPVHCTLTLDLKGCRCSEANFCLVCKLYQTTSDDGERHRLSMILHSGQMRILAAGDTVVIQCRDWGTAAFDMAKMSWTRLEQVPFAVFTPTLRSTLHSGISC